MSKKLAGVFNAIGGIFWLIALLVCKDKPESNLGGEAWTQGAIQTIICCLLWWTGIGWLAWLVFAILGIVNVTKDIYSIPVLEKLGWNWFKNL